MTARFDDDLRRPDAAVTSSMAAVRGACGCVLQRRGRGGRGEPLGHGVKRGDGGGCENCGDALVEASAMGGKKRRDEGEVSREG